MGKFEFTTNNVTGRDEAKDVTKTPQTTTMTAAKNSENKVDHVKIFISNDQQVVATNGNDNEKKEKIVVAIEVTGSAATAAAAAKKEKEAQNGNANNNNNNSKNKVVVVEKKGISFCEFAIDKDDENFDDDDDDDDDNNNAKNESESYQLDIVWFNVVKIAALHLGAIAAFPLLPFAADATILFAYGLIIATSFGVQIGAHRLWSHRSYDAVTPLRVILAAFFALAMQNDLYEWCRDHRTHHKFAETSADPHDARRGFFFSHMGWLMCRKHPAVLRRGATIDLSDLLADPVVRFQRRHYPLLVAMFWAVLPTAIPVAAWHESLMVSFVVCVLLRYTITLHITWFVNSWAHMYGRRPYNRRSAAVEAAIIRHALAGEGFHNYHHTFPWDYCASERGPTAVFNPAAAIINAFYALGWATARKRASKSLVARRREMIAKIDAEEHADFYEHNSGCCGFGGSGQSSCCSSVIGFAIEWISGLLVVTFPLYALFGLKYALLRWCPLDTCYPSKPQFVEQFHLFDYYLV